MRGGVGVKLSLAGPAAAFAGNRFTPQASTATVMLERGAASSATVNAAVPPSGTVTAGGMTTNCTVLTPLLASTVWKCHSSLHLTDFRARYGPRGRPGSL